MTKNTLMKFIDSCVGNIARKIEDEFRESDHPRDKGGKFTSKGNEGRGGGSSKPSKGSSKPMNISVSAGGNTEGLEAEAKKYGVKAKLGKSSHGETSVKLSGAKEDIRRYLEEKFYGSKEEAREFSPEVYENSSSGEHSSPDHIEYMKNRLEEGLANNPDVGDEILSSLGAYSVEEAYELIENDPETAWDNLGAWVDEEEVEWSKEDKENPPFPHGQEEYDDYDEGNKGRGGERDPKHEASVEETDDIMQRVSDTGIDVEEFMADLGINTSRIPEGRLEETLSEELYADPNLRDKALKELKNYAGEEDDEGYMGEEETPDYTNDKYGQALQGIDEMVDDDPQDAVKELFNYIEANEGFLHPNRMSRQQVEGMISLVSRMRRKGGMAGQLSSDVEQNVEKYGRYQGKQTAAFSAIRNSLMDLERRGKI